MKLIKLDEHEISYLGKHFELGHIDKYLLNQTYVYDACNTQFLLNFLIENKDDKFNIDRINMTTQQSKMLLENNKYNNGIKILLHTTLFEYNYFLYLSYVDEHILEDYFRDICIVRYMCNDLINGILIALGKLNTLLSVNINGDLVKININLELQKIVEVFEILNINIEKTNAILPLLETLKNITETEFKKLEDIYIENIKRIYHWCKVLVDKLSKININVNVSDMVLIENLETPVIDLLGQGVFKK